MDKLSKARALIAASFLMAVVLAQSRLSAQSQLPAEDRSFYLNEPVIHPEALSGIWESPNGQGGAVGIHLELASALPGDDDHVAWTPQAWQHLQVDVYERKGAERAFGEGNGFSDSQRGGGVQFEDGRLQLHFVSHWKNSLSIDLDLLLQPDGCWHGRFHRDNFDRVVSLCRPTPGAGVRLSALAGTWSASTRFGQRCVHVVQTGTDRFAGWSDSMIIPGHIRYGPGAPGPHQLFEYYGSLAKVEVAGDGQVSVEFGAYSGICCPHDFMGKVSGDGSTLEGEFPPGPNQAPYAASFAKMRGDSCVEHSPRR